MYQLPNLNYLFQDLEPFIDVHTMAIHYHKHEQNYLNKLNEILLKNKYDFKYNLCELLFHIDEFNEKDKEDILFNLGGVINHNLYWKSMSPNYLKKPKGNLKKYIDSKYGDFENFWLKFKETALKLMGSGYTFLVLTKDKDLDIINFSNQDTPLIHNYIPLFVVDLWEHAYYLNYENDKSKYLDNFKEIADFTYASEVFNNIINNLNN